MIHTLKIIKNTKIQAKSIAFIQEKNMSFSIFIILKSLVNHGFQNEIIRKLIFFNLT